MLEQERSLCIFTSRNLPLETENIIIHRHRRCHSKHWVRSKRSQRTQGVKDNKIILTNVLLVVIVIVRDRVDNMVVGVILAVFPFGDDSE